MIGGDGWDSPKLDEIGGSAVDGMLFLDPLLAGDASAQQCRTSSKDIQERFNGDARRDGRARLRRDDDPGRRDQDAPGRTERAKMRDALAATKDFDGVTGKITIDAKRNASEVRGRAQGERRQGDTTYVATVAP